MQPMSSEVVQLLSTGDVLETLEAAEMLKYKLAVDISIGSSDLRARASVTNHRDL